MNGEYAKKIQDTKGVLLHAKAQMISLSADCAQRGIDWDTAERIMRWARSIDEIVQEMGGIAEVIPRVDRPQTRVVQFGTKLPYYCVVDGKLAKRGKSKALDKPYWEQRVPKEHYDLIVKKIARIAQVTNDFRTQNNLVDRREMPVHEPSLVVGVLMEKRLLDQIQKGRYGVVAPSEFESNAAKVWNELPRVGRR